MKKIITMLGLVMAMSSSLLAQTIKVNGTKAEIETKIIDGRTFVKLRQVSELLDCEITYDANTKSAIVTKQEVNEEIKDVKLTYTIGNLDYEYAYNDRIKGRGMDVTPQVIDGSIYLPIRYVAEPLGYDISMNENKEIVLEKRA